MSQADVDRMREGYTWKGWVHPADGGEPVYVEVETTLGEANRDAAKEAARLTERSFADFYTTTSDGKSGAHTSSHPYSCGESWTEY